MAARDCRPVGGGRGRSHRWPPESGSPVELRVAWWGSQDRHNRTIKAIELFQKKYPQIKVTYEFAGWGDYWTKMTTQAAGRNLPDVMQQDYAYITEWSSRGLIAPLDDYVKSGTIDTPRRRGRGDPGRGRERQASRGQPRLELAVLGARRGRLQEGGGGAAAGELDVGGLREDHDRPQPEAGHLGDGLADVGQPDLGGAVSLGRAVAVHGRREPRSGTRATSRSWTTSTCCCACRRPTR